MLQHVDTIIRANWVLPMTGRAKLLHNHAVVIKHDKIEAIIPIDALSTRYSATKTHYLEQHLVMPGLVNAHTHAAMSLMRGLADDIHLQDWLENHIFPAENALLCPEFVQDGMRLGIAEMLKSGVTCFNDMYYYANDMADVAHEMKIRAVVAQTLLQNKQDDNIDDDVNFAQTEALLEYVKNKPLVSAAVAPHTPYTTSPEIWLKAYRMACRHNVPFHMHLHETDQEITAHRQQYHVRPLQHLVNRDIGSSKVIAVHMTQCNVDDINILKKYKINVVHCPQSNMKLASGYCPVQKLLDNGINVALGTDGAASNNDACLFDEMRSAALSSKLMTHDPSSLPAYQVLEMATINGAKALGMRHNIGSLETGKQADIIAINLNSFNTQPIYNPISHLVYALNSRQVSDVWIAGQQRLKEHQLIKVDEQGIIAKAKLWRQKLLKFALK